MYSTTTGLGSIAGTPMTVPESNPTSSFVHIREAAAEGSSMPHVYLCLCFFTCPAGSRLVVED